MKTNYVLVDYENVPVKSLSLLNREDFRVWIFLGPKNNKLDKSLVISGSGLPERPAYEFLEASGKNALDLQIAFYLGTLAKEDPTASFYIISRDKGFDPLIQHLKSKQISVTRSESIEAIPSIQPVKKAKNSPANLTEKEQLELVITDLRKKKEAKPRKVKSLLNTIQSICGKDLPESRIETLYKKLVELNYVKTDGTRVEFKGL